jgi:hypothetical protein
VLNFLKNMLTKRQTDVEVARANYVRLIGKAAVEGDLAVADANLMNEVCTLLGLSPEHVAGDVAAAVRLKKLEPIAGELEQRRLAHKAASQKFNNVAADFPARMARLRAELAQAGNEKELLARKFGESGAALAEADRIKTENPRLSGRFDVSRMPQNTDRYLVRGWADEERKPRTLLVEAYNGETAVVRAPWQSEEEFSELLRDAQAIQKGARYLYRKGAKPRPLILDGAAQQFEALLESRSPMSHEPHLIPWPGSDPADFDDMMRQLREKWGVPQT